MNYKLPRGWDEDIAPPKEGVEDSPTEDSEESDESSWDEGPSKKPRVEDRPVLPIASTNDYWTAGAEPDWNTWCLHT